MVVFLATNHEKTVLRVDVAQKLQMEPVVAAFRAGFLVQELFQFNPDRFHGLRVLGHEKHIVAVVADDVVITGGFGDGTIQVDLERKPLAIGATDASGQDFQSFEFYHDSLLFDWILL
jgi:hypothetical protein